MADDIVQTIKIEVEGSEAAAAELEKVSDSASKSFDETKKAADTAGLSIEDFGKLSEKTQAQYVELSQRVQSESQGMVQATKDVAQSAAQTGKGAEGLGKGLDEVSTKSGVSNRELRSLGKIMKEMGAGEVAGLGIAFAKMANTLGPLGVAAFAVAEAFAFVKGKMKEAEEAAKAVTQTFANLAKTSAEMKAENDASFWGTTASEMKKAANDASLVADQLRNIARGAKEVIDPLTSSETETKAFVAVLERAGIAVGDLMADTKKLGVASQQAAMEAAKIYEKMSPIEKLNFEKVLKGLGFTDAQLKSIEKGSEALKKIQQPLFTPEQQRSIDNLSRGWDGFAAASKKAWAMVAGDAETGTRGWMQSVAVGFADAMAVVGQFEREAVQAIAQVVTTTVPNAWQWIKDTAASVWEEVKSLAQQAYDEVVKFVTTAPGNAWQWIVDAAASVWEEVKSLAQQAYDAVVKFVTTAPGNAWQWIADAATSVWEKTKSLAQQAYDEVVSFVTKPVANAWQWIVDTWNAMLAKLGLGGGAKSGELAPAPAGQSLASGGLLGGRGSGTSDSNLAWVSRGEYIMPARAVSQPGVLAFLEALRRSGGLLGFASGGLVPAYASGGETRESGLSLDTLIQKLKEVFDIVTRIASDSTPNADATFDALKDVAGQLETIALKVVSNSNAVVDLANKARDILRDLAVSAAGHASGGLLGGRGSGTSDSNLAWVSRGEFIQPAHVVRQPGVLAFLEALRFSGGNLRRVLDGMGRFALGGMVMPRLSMPALAGGGMNNVTINFPGLPEITGLRASSAAVEDLQRAASMAQVRSGGRKPSRYR